MLKTYQIIFVLFFINVAPSLASESNNESLMAMYQKIQNKNVDLLQGQPLTITSNIKSNRLSADIYAINNFAFNDIVDGLSKPSEWCQFITLHLNIKACTFNKNQSQSFVSFYAGRKFYEPAEDAYELRYRFNINESTEDYFKLSLSAKEGPFGTSDYLIVLELLKVNKDVVLHMSLSYQTSFSSRLGTSVYLSTIGADKVGFSKVSEDGSTHFIKGVEGIIERNVMRYFLALTTYLKYQKEPNKMPGQWFLATEKYAKQLHEVEYQEYLDAKKKEYAQQREMQSRITIGMPVFKSLAAED